jgi:hypothetical protein
VEERDSEETCTLGRGIIDRLGGREGGMRMPLGVCEGAVLGEVSGCGGENARCISVVSSSSSSTSGCRADTERQCMAGAGIWLGVLGRGRGVVPRLGV